MRAPHLTIGRGHALPMGLGDADDWRDTRRSMVGDVLYHDTRSTSRIPPDECLTIPQGASHLATADHASASSSATRTHFE